jgi:hypothetical protein
MKSRISGLVLMVAAVMACAFAVPAGAGAATVVNGGFESGDLNGWQTHYDGSAGEWFVSSAQAGKESGWPPPTGNFFARDEEGAEETMILYQDIALEPGYSHRLSMQLAYFSSAPISVPNPNTLGYAEGNQQLRVDVMKPSAPIESLDPNDILATVFATKTGDPEEIPWTRVSADLSPFAGQTVRLRIAHAVYEDYFFAGVDDVSVTSTPPPSPPPPPPPANTISRGRLTLNKKNGTGRLAINVPGPGTLTEVGKGKKKKVKGASLVVTAAGTIQVPLKPTGLGRKLLNANGKLKSGIEVTFTPTGGTANTQPYKVTLKKTLKP